MTPKQIIAQLQANRAVFEGLFTGLPTELTQWKAADDQWSLLEILCHLYDEELEDFKARMQFTLNMPGVMPPTIDPEGWVKQHDYSGQDYAQKLSDFLAARSASVTWLETLSPEQLAQAHKHPFDGQRSLLFYLNNWLAHDYIHIRQILKVKMAYLKATGDESVHYAGNW